MNSYSKSDGDADFVFLRTEAASKFYQQHGFRRAVSDLEVTHILELANAA